MALYTIEITAPTKNPKALYLIAELSGMNVADLKQRMKAPPVVIMDSVPLVEAVAVERQLRRLGLSIHVRKLIAEVEPYKSSASSDATRKRDDEVIVIPDAEVKVLPFQEKEPPPKARVMRKLVWSPEMVRGGAIFLAAVALIILAIVYLTSYSKAKHNESELAIAIDQWTHTLSQQEALLDKGLSPQQIFSKLEEIEGKINRLYELLKMRKAVGELKDLYEHSRSVNQGLLSDLDFRRRLDDAGFPIHPTCLVDQGMVRGMTELPDGAHLRVLLFSYAAGEPPPLIAQTSDGMFRVILDPVLERTVFDARATVAPFSQQPASVQVWAKDLFHLSQSSQIIQQNQPAVSRASVDSASAPKREPTIDEVPIPRRREPAYESKAASSTPLATLQQAPVEQPLTEPAIASKDVQADAGMVTALQRFLDDWTGQVSQADKLLQSGQVQTLEAIYQRLLTLEAQIDHMIHLLTTDNARNRAVMIREDAYGAAVAVRQDLQHWHETFMTRNNPLYLETSLRRSLAAKGFPLTDVVVQTAPSNSDVFQIAIHAGRAPKETLFPALAMTLTEEFRRTPVQVGLIQLTHDGRLLAWTPDRLRQACEALKASDGVRRCVAIMEREP
jgi:hypothetical protein